MSLAGGLGGFIIFSDSKMSDQEEYEEDFENCYEDDFEVDAELEVPVQQHPHQDDNQDHTTQDVQQYATALDAHVWPSLSTSLHSPSRGRRQGVGGVLFGKSLFAAGPASTDNDSPSTSNDAHITLQPALPPLLGTQRRHAAAALQRSKQLQQHVKLHLSTQLELLTLHPLSLYQQHSQGVGVYAAGQTGAACQTRQLDQDIREQDVQTDQVEQKFCGCQVPEDLYSSVLKQVTGSIPGQQLPAELLAAADPAFAEFLGWAVPQLLFELGRAEVAGAAECRLATSAAGPCFCAVQTAVQTSITSSSNGRGSTSSHSTDAGPRSPMLVGELQLAGDSFLAGRPIHGLAGPPTPGAAAAAAEAITAAGAAATSRHLLLVCFGPVSMPTESAVKEHGLAGLGCLCIWDLQLAGQQSAQSQPVAGGSNAPHGVVQILVSEGQPTCCCWGTGEAACLVFAGMNEGVICCWDLSEPNEAHSTGLAAMGPAVQQQQQLTLPARRPSYTSGVPVFAGTSLSGDDATRATASSNSRSCADDGVVCSTLGSTDSITALAAVPHTSSSSGSVGLSSGGCVCRLVALTAGGHVTVYSVMLGDAGSDVAVSDLGMRTGGRVWLVKVCEGLQLGKDVARPIHLKSAGAVHSNMPDRLTQSNSNEQASVDKTHQAGAVQSSSCLLVLPGTMQQLLVGTVAGRVMKGAALGATLPPHEYISVQWHLAHHAAGVTDALRLPDASNRDSVSGRQQRCSRSSSLLGQAQLVEQVTSLAVCPVLADAWAAGHGCGLLAVFSQRQSWPCWLWQHPFGAAVVAVRLQASPCPVAYTAPCGSAEPCCLEVLSTAAGTTCVLTSCSCAAGSASTTGNSQQTSSQPPPGTVVSLAVGFTDGSSSIYQLAGAWLNPVGLQKGGLQALQELLDGGT